MSVAPTEPTAVWVDVDTGVDDALALLYLVASPRVELVGVSAVAGNVSVEQAARNTLALLDAVGASDLPVHLGAAKPLLGPARDATGFHGPTGLGDVEVPPSERGPDPRSALEALRDAVATRPGEITLVALGPLTTVAHFVSVHPASAAKLRGVIAMTGAVEGGNATASAEFNCWHDPEALQIVLESGVPLTIFPLDRFAEATVPVDVSTVWATGPDARRWLASGFLRHCTLPGEHVSWLGDAAVAVVTAVPELATVEDFPVAVELAPGLSRGRTVVDRRGRDGEDEQHGGAGMTTRASVVTSIDAERLADEYVTALGGLV